MDFLSIGPGELFFILVIALLIFGPERLVDIARTLGRWSHRVSQAGREFSRAVQAEADLSKEVADVRRDLAAAARDINVTKDLSDARQDFSSAVTEQTYSSDTRKGHKPPEKQPEQGQIQPPGHQPG